MNKSVMPALFALGLAAVGWVGWGFVGGSPLALAMTAAIGAVYVLGAYELRQFRAATASLNMALNEALNVAPSAAQNGHAAQQPVADLGAWLARLAPALRGPVRQRIEGERVALPGPALTPYLVGLLVMLGMLGTFLGMVVTFHGAVFALETSSNLEAIRAALAAPIKGLGLSFGTSVAGVATSALLGLLSALCRRERLEAVRLLDARIPTLFRAFSSAQRRDDLFLALQTQAQAMPLIAERLQGLIDATERRHSQLGEQLLAQQQGFHRDAAAAYTQLASSVGASLQDSLNASAQQAGATLRPVVEQAMTALAQEAQHSHERLREATDAQLQALSAQWQGTARDVADTWATALRSQAHTHDALVAQLDGALQKTTQALDQRSTALVAALQESAAQAHAAQTQADQQRLEGWRRTMEATASTLSAEWQRAGAHTLAQQHSAQQALEAAATHLTERMTEQAARTLGGAATLLEQSDALLRARTEAEAQWTQAQGQRMDELTRVWRTELAALRDAEAARGQAAVERLDALQDATAQHLATLGAALEAPLTRLLQTASDVPQAAAEVITELRQEMTRLSERDNIALAERTAMTEQLGQLLHSVNDATQQQRAAIDALVGSAAQVLEQAGQQFAQALGAQAGKVDEAAAQQRAAIDALVGSAAQVLEQAGQQFAQALGAQAGKVDEVATHVAASAVELASLGEAFSHGVGQFSASNEQLMHHLQGIEAALSQSMQRSDEQLAYYVAQAREVIDLSISAQQGIVEDLRRLHASAAKAPAQPGVAA